MHCELWCLEDSKINEYCTTWRRGLRIIWINLPFRLCASDIMLYVGLMIFLCMTKYVNDFKVYKYLCEWHVQVRPTTRYGVQYASTIHWIHIGLSRLDIDWVHPCTEITSPEIPPGENLVKCVFSRFPLLLSTLSGATFTLSVSCLHIIM